MILLSEIATECKSRKIVRAAFGLDTLFLPVFHRFRNMTILVQLSAGVTLAPNQLQFR